MGRARDIRLLQDQQKIYNLVNFFPFMELTTWKGLPPSEYVFNFALNGYLNIQGDIANRHELRLIFPEKYPFSTPPKFSFTKGLFHPNVYRNGDVCHGWSLNNWHPGIHIDDLLLDIIKMICFKPSSFNLRSPANYDCDKNWVHTHRIPADATPVNYPRNGLTPPTNKHAPTNKLVKPSKPIRVVIKNEQISSGQAGYTQNNTTTKLSTPISKALVKVAKPNKNRGNRP